MYNPLLRISCLRETLYFSSVSIPTRKNLRLLLATESYTNTLPLIMKKTFFLLLILLISVKSFACSCECDGDCSFSQISKGSEFVALVKVIEYSDFLDQEIYDYDGKMPLSMTIEVIKKYVGSEKRKTIKFGVITELFVDHTLPILK